MELSIIVDLPVELCEKIIASEMVYEFYDSIYMTVDFEFEHGKTSGPPEDCYPGYESIQIIDWDTETFNSEQVKMIDDWIDSDEGQSQISYATNRAYEYELELQYENYKEYDDD